MSGTYGLDTYIYTAIGNIQSKAGVSYGYTHPLHKHALTTIITNGQTLMQGYDLNGNTPALALRASAGASVTQRVEVSGTSRITYTQQWDAENRLTVVTNTAVTPNAISKFVYDGDGARVMQVHISGTQIITTAYAGAIEVQITATQRITKTYYSAGSQLIALRQYTAPTSSVLYYLHGDHLGSVSVTTCGAGCGTAGTVLARQLYDAWGNVRGGLGTMPTDVGFTAQRSDATGLMHFKARYYAPALGRFVSADTIVPEPGNPQSLNRFSYTYNNPVKYIDPSGYKVADGCTTLGCASDENWAVNLLKAVAQTAGFSDSIDDSLVQLALGFFQWSVEHYTLEAGSMTLGDAARDAWQATRTFVQNTGRTPAEALTMQRSLGNLFDFTLVAGAMMATEHFKASEYEFVKSYLNSLKPLSRGSTANLAQGTTLPRDLREQLAIEQARANPGSGRELPLSMNDPRWPVSEGWKKMQLIIQQGGGPVEILGAGGPINIHYVWNTITGMVDDLKIVTRGQ